MAAKKKRPEVRAEYLKVSVTEEVDVCFGRTFESHIAYLEELRTRFQHLENVSISIEPDAYVEAHYRIDGYRTETDGERDQRVRRELEDQKEWDEERAEREKEALKTFEAQENALEHELRRVQNQLKKLRGESEPQTIQQ